MRVLLGLFVLLLVLAGGFLFALRSGYLPTSSVDHDAFVVSPEEAARAEAKLGRLTDQGQEIRLTDVELTSLLRYRPESWSLGPITAATVRIGGDTIRLNGIVDPDQLPPRPEIEAIRVFLPDTTVIDVSGRVGPLDAGTAAIEITSLEIAGMPFPSAYFPYIVDRLGLPGDDRLPSGSFALPLPAGVTSARVEQGVLVLTPLAP